MKKETGDTVRFEDVSEIGAIIRALESAQEQSEESKELVRFVRSDAYELVVIE